MSADERRAPGEAFTRATLPALENACACLLPWNEPEEEGDEPLTGSTLLVAWRDCVACGGTGARKHPRPAPTPDRLRALAMAPWPTSATELRDRADVARLARYGARWITPGAANPTTRKATSR